MANTPFLSKRAPYYSDIPDEKWNNWRWQLSHRLNSVDDFENIFDIFVCFFLGERFPDYLSNLCLNSACFDPL